MNQFSPSSSDYLLHLESFSLNHKTCQSWAHHDDPAINIFSRPSTQSTSSVSFGAGADEFMLCNGRPSKFDAAIPNSLLPLHSSMADAHFLQVFQAGQPQPDHLHTNYAVYMQQPQPNRPTKQQLRAPNPPHAQHLNPSTSASSKPLPLTSPQPPQKATAPTRRKHPPPARPLIKTSLSTRTSTSSSPQPSPSPSSPQAASPTNRLGGGGGSGGVRKPRHSVTEKRYRTNLNEKIALLRESIPSLRRGGRDGGNDGNNNSNSRKLETCDAAAGGKRVQPGAAAGGAAAAGNLKKAAIFSEATAHIRHLEIRNARLVDECQALRARLEAFEMLFLAARSGSCSSSGKEIDFDVSPVCYG